MEKKIVRLEIKNYLGISSIELNPSKINIIDGGNGKGKTSILDAISKGISNATKARPKLVKDQEEEATILIDFSDGTEVFKRIKPDGKIISKVSKGGATIPKPETYLNSLVGGFNFNPVDFISKTDKEQTEILLNLVEHKITNKDCLQWFNEVPDVNLDQHSLLSLQAILDWFYDKRANANKLVKLTENQITASFETLPDNFEVEKWKAVNLEDIINKKSEALTNNSKVEKSEAYLKTIEEKKKLANSEKENGLLKVEDKIKGEKEELKKKFLESEAATKETILELKEKILKLERNIKTESDLLDVQVERIENTVDGEKQKILNTYNEEIIKIDGNKEKADGFIKDLKVVDIFEIDEEIQEAKTNIGYIALAENKAQLENDLSDRKKEAKILDGFVDICREKPAEIIKSLELPIKGLGINEEGLITINKKPIKNLSTSESILLSLEVARATSKGLQLINIDRFESLDKETQELFLSEIEKDNFQYFITNVTSGDLDIKKVENKKEEFSLNSGKVEEKLFD